MILLHLYVCILLHCLGNGCSPSQPRVPLLSNPCQEFLYLSNSTARVETFGTGLGTVHDSVAPVHTEWIPKFVQSLCLVSIPAINDPPVCLHQYSRPQVPVSIPPVGRTGSRTTSTQDTLVQTIQLSPVILTGAAAGLRASCLLRHLSVARAG